MGLRPGTGSKWYAAGAPMHCAGCGQPFPREGNRVCCLHTENGYFCDEFCETDHLVAVAGSGRAGQ